MLQFFSGLLLFLLGIHWVKCSFQLCSDSYVENFLRKITDNIFINILLGIILTSLIQSSSALSLILIGLLESDLISLKSSLAVMIGGNLGTTLTIQIISLPVISHYKWGFFLGLVLILFSLKYRKLRSWGYIFISFSILFAGMNFMSSSFSTPLISILLKKIAEESNLHYLYFILGGVFITAILQSSSVAGGIIVTLVGNNVIELYRGIAFILGSNIGTCITAFLAGTCAGSEAKKLAVGHFLFNLIGVITVIFIYNDFVNLIILMDYEPARQLAYAHTIFNVFTLFIIMPFFNILLSILEGKKKLW